MKSLYTPADVKSVREQFIKQQGNIDPILKEPFKETVALDHDWKTQHCRAALNRNTNAFEGLVTNAHRRCLSWLTDLPLPAILRNLADYLEQDYSCNPYHPQWQKKVKTEFNKLSAKQKDAALSMLQYPTGSNDKLRKESFAKAVLDRKFGYATILEILKEVNKDES